MLEEMGYSSTISERPEKLWLRCMQVAGTGPQSKFSKNVNDGLTETQLLHLSSNAAP